MCIVFKKLIFDGYSYSKSKSEITTDLIYNNLTKREYFGTDMINKLYFAVNNEVLPNDYSDRFKSYKEKKENDRLLEIRERLFKDVPIEVYNYLIVVYSYYCILTAE